MRLSRLVTAASLFLVTMAVNLQVPLYRTYAQAAGYGNGQTAVVFAAYVLGLLPVLTLLGGLSDRLGRKPVLLAGLLSAMLATALMIVSPSMSMLLLARILQGIGVGLSVGAGTAYLAENLAEQPARAASYVAVTTSLGFGGGALFTSAFLLHEPSLLPPSYGITLGLTLICTVLALRLPHLPAVGGALLRLPAFPTGTLPVGLSIALAWAVTGLVIAVVPAQLAQHGLAAWTGLALFLVNGTGALVQPWARRLAVPHAMRLGFILLPLGYGVLIVGAWLGTLGLVLLGAAVAGSACYGFTYLGGLAAVVNAGAAQRARAVSGYFLCAYLGFGLPSILIGFIADQIGVLNALLAFGAVIIAVSAGLARQLQPSRSKALN